ncbi:MAG: radical SAM/SPASM domain-containing protein [Candidatus Omnitrophica bacterium]|nr:radical SAM/SPASM domain-containing protein [Candidatus Omnitrophota bacterium]
MTIIQGKDIRVSDRQKLEKVIPLEMPYVLFIEPTNLCNIQCQFCPTGDKNLRKMRPNGTMLWETYCRAISGLEEFGKKLKRINFYKDGESLLNKKFCDMVLLAKDRNVSDSLWLKTNGLLLNPELNQKLIDSGLDMIGISVTHTTEEGYKRISGVSMDYAKFKENIRDLFKRRNECKIYIKIADTGLSQSEKDKFLNDFGDISDYVAVEGLHGWSMSDVKDFTLGTESKTFDGLPFVRKVVCPWPFYELAINWNGSVSVCNEDWVHGTTVGDINKETLKEIWNGKRLYEIQKMMLEGRRSENKVCANCFYLSCSPDNIDEYRFQILEKMKSRFK